MLKKPLPEGTCPAQNTVDLFGGKWKTTILYKVAVAPEPIRFNALRRLIPKVTQRMLTQQLRNLERDGLVIRTFYPEVPARVEYTLSPLGESLVPIFKTLCAWNNEHMKAVEKARKSYDSSSAPPPS